MQRVLILENQLLVGAGIQALLEKAAGLEIRGISPGNQQQLVQAVKQFRPDVIVLDEASRLVSPPRLLALLKDYPNLRIVVVSANHDRVRVYQKQETQLSRAIDIFDLIRPKGLYEQAA